MHVDVRVRVCSNLHACVHVHVCVRVYGYVHVFAGAVSTPLCTSAWPIFHRAQCRACRHRWLAHISTCGHSAAHRRSAERVAACSTCSQHGVGEGRCGSGRAERKAFGQQRCITRAKVWQIVRTRRVCACGRAGEDGEPQWAARQGRQLFGFESTCCHVAIHVAKQVMMWDSKTERYKVPANM